MDEEKVIYLMRGIPASGKSFVARLIANGTDGIICSTDDYWSDVDGNYNFVPTKLGEAHLANQRKVAEAMGRGEPSIIVDNTNISARDLKPYLLLANLFNYTVQLIDVGAEMETCVERNITRESHSVPESVIRNMHYKICNEGRIDLSSMRELP